jgi:hypothetical protein
MERLDLLSPALCTGLRLIHSGARAVRARISTSDSAAAESRMRFASESPFLT